MTRETNSKVFFSPHNDDESLFGAFTLLGERPHVVVVCKSYVQEQRGTGVTAEMREAETAAAMEILGCTWEQWEFRDDDPDWLGISWRMHELKEQGVTQVWAPAFADEGHDQHNQIGRKARHFWYDTSTFYTTYHYQGGRQLGAIVPREPEWVTKKLQALACYPSQHAQEWMVPHFERGLFEYYAPAYETTPCPTCGGLGEVAQ